MNHTLKAEHSFPRLMTINNYVHSWDGQKGICACPILNDHGTNSFHFTSCHFYCFSCGSGGTLRQFELQMVARRDQITYPIDDECFATSLRSIRKIIISEFNKNVREANELLAINLFELKNKKNKGLINGDQFVLQDRQLKYGYDCTIAGLEMASESLFSERWLQQ